YLAGQVMPSIWAFYTKFTYNWSDAEIGYSLAFVGVMVAIVQGGLIKWSQTKLGSHTSIYTGLSFYLVGLTLFAIANQSWMLYAFTFIYALGGIGPPSIQGIISGLVPPNEQGELQGMMTALMSISTILSPLLMTNLFYNFTKPDTIYYFPGAPFAAAAILVLISFFVVKRGINNLTRHRA
ncbi:MAG TPA: MFS transporter, partial [Bacteroidia bacterium]|nr:MFS transporter [Bacteroidia bacterium]